MRRIGIATATLALLAPSALAQGTFESGSTGEDGALTFAANEGVVDFNPDDTARFGRVLDPDRDYVYHFTSITIPAGTTVRLTTQWFAEGRPVVWLASGDVRIEGTLDLDGAEGHAWNGLFVGARAGAGGYAGGVGGATGLNPTTGNGPGGGATGVSGADWGASAGHAIAGTAAGSPAGGAVYGNAFLRPLVGGSGGGGGRLVNGGAGSGGGGGGGAIVVASSSRIDLLGSIRAQGGNGGARANGLTVSGGGGSGGAVRLIARTIEGGGTINVSGGSNVANGVGGFGRARLEAFRFPTMPTVIPVQALTRSAPSAVFLTETAPLVRVVRVAGVDVAANPTGSFDMPDVAFAAAGAVTIELEARNLPAGTVVNLTFQPENGVQVTATSTPLVVGTGGVLTATATASFQAGYTRVFARATWTP